MKKSVLCLQRKRNITGSFKKSSFFLYWCFLEKEKDVQAVPQSTLLYAKSEGMERRREGGRREGRLLDQFQNLVT